MKTEQMPGADRLTVLSSALFELLCTNNHRLTQKLSPEDVLFALRCVVKKGRGGCVMVQPGHSGYAWSVRKTPILFAAITDDTSVVKVRIKRSNSNFNSSATPSYWPELKFFPRGDAVTKLRNWANSEESLSIPVAHIEALPEITAELDHYLQEWEIELGTKT